MTVIITIAACLMALVAALLVWLIIQSSSGRQQMAQQGQTIELLHQRLEFIKAAQDKTGADLHKSLTEGQNNIHQNLRSSQKVLSELNREIGQLRASSKQIFDMGSDLRRLQEILSSPKLRGQIGEWSLKTLLENVLPADSWQMQHRFRDGKIVDAVVKMNGLLVPIDAKFPLPAFERIVNADSDSERLRLRKQFHTDVTKHIDKIADSYILPAENTLDFALVYIPAENVYYETIVKHDGDTKDVLAYALERKVIPVSPNLLYAYLMTVVMGLHGLQIQKQAAQIRANLQKLNSDFATFISDYDTLGNHIRNSGKKYDEAYKKLDRFGLQLESIQAENPDQLPETKGN